MTAKTSTWSARGGTRYTRVNQLGWAVLCPAAAELVWHGSTPLPSLEPGYPTGEESRQLHDKLKRAVDQAVREVLKYSVGAWIVRSWEEKEVAACIHRENAALCARGRCDLTYLARINSLLLLINVDVSSARVNPAKPWQTAIRSIALYHEYRVPVTMIIVSPDTLMYKPLLQADYDRVVARIARERSLEGFEPSPSLCSLCELRHYCPHVEAI